MNKLRKAILVVTILVVVMGMTVAGVVYFYDGDSTQLKKEAITYRDPNLTVEEVALMNQRVADIQKKLDMASSDEEKYKAHMQLGFEYLPLGEYEKAREQYLKASSILPDNPTPWAELYVVERNMQDYENARFHLEKAIELNPVNVQYWRWRIELERDYFTASNDMLDALHKEGLDKTGQNIDMIVLYAYFLEERKNDLLGAVQMWKKANELNPEDKVIYDEEITRIQEKLK